MRRVTGVRALPIIGLMFLALGLIGLLAAGLLTVVELRSGRSARANGVVVEADNRAMVQFTTEAGETIRFRNTVMDTTQRGDHIPVAYDPDNPRNARVDGFAGRWLLRDVFAGLGAAFLAIGGGLFLAGRRFLRPVI